MFNSFNKFKNIITEFCIIVKYIIIGNNPSHSAKSITLMLTGVISCFDTQFVVTAGHLDDFEIWIDDLVQ